MDVPGLVASAVPALVWCRGQEHHGARCGVTHRVVTLHAPQRLVLGGDWPPHLTSDVLQLALGQKRTVTVKRTKKQQVTHGSS